MLFGVANGDYYLLVLTLCSFVGVAFVEAALAHRGDDDTGAWRVPCGAGDELLVGVDMRHGLSSGIGCLVRATRKYYHCGRGSWSSSRSHSVADVQ